MGIRTEKNASIIQHILSKVLCGPNSPQKQSQEESTNEIQKNNAFSPDLDSIDEFYAKDVIGHDPATPENWCGTDCLKTIIESYNRAFPDMTYHINEETIVAKDNMVAFHWTGTGTHEGELLDIQATGKTVKITAMSICKFNDEGKIAEIWQIWDRQGMLEQLKPEKKLKKVGE